MLIIPIQHRPSLRHAPLVTIALIALNALVFFAYQSQDEQRSEFNTRLYMDSELSKIEYKHGVDFLEEKQPEIAEILGQSGDTDEHHYWLAYFLADNASFDAQIKSIWQDSSTEDLNQWQHARHDFEALRKQSSSQRFGIIPAQPDWYRFISNAFLHGSWEHILGNMVFLFIFGFVLEQMLGAMRYLGLYLLTAIAASAAYCGFNLNSITPAIGASGAVSGLMGAYIVLFGLQRIRFFYALGFYFGEFKAPALMVLPLWIGKEVYGQLFLEDQVAYSAHLGGLISGALLLPLLKIGVGVKRSTQASSQGTKQFDSSTSDFAEKRMIVEGYIAALDYDSAFQNAQKYWLDNSHSLDLTEAYFSAAKLKPKSKSFHSSCFEILKHFSSQKTLDRAQAQFIAKVLREYDDVPSQKPVLKHMGLLTRLATRAFNSGHTELGLQLLEYAIISDPSAKMLEQPLRFAIEYWQSQRNIENAHRLSLLLNRL